MLTVGVASREWLHLLSHKMLDPQYALFQYARDDVYTLQINPDSAVNPVRVLVKWGRICSVLWRAVPCRAGWCGHFCAMISQEHLSYFHFVGRVLGLAVFHGHHIDAGFTLPFYKVGLGLTDLVVFVCCDY